MYAMLNTDPTTGFRPGVQMNGLGCDCGGGPGNWNPTKRAPGMGSYRRRFSLGALAPADVANSIMPQSVISKVPGFTEDIWNDIEQSAEKGSIQGFVQTCNQASGPSGAQIVQTATSSGSAIALAIPAIAAGPFAPFVLIGAALVGLFSQLFEAHAMAVKKEQQVECAAVPAFNDGITAISQAVAAGTISPQTGISSSTQLLQEFQQQISSIMKNDPTQCNAGCVWDKCAQAAVAELQSQFTDMISAAATVAPAASGTSSSQVAGAGSANLSTEEPAAAESWFTENTIISSIPNWGVLALAAGAFMFFGGKL